MVINSTFEKKGTDWNEVFETWYEQSDELLGDLP